MYYIQFDLYHRLPVLFMAGSFAKFHERVLSTLLQIAISPLASRLEISYL